MSSSLPQGEGREGLAGESERSACWDRGSHSSASTELLVDLEERATVALPGVMGMSVLQEEKLPR